MITENLSICVFTKNQSWADYGSQGSGETFDLPRPMNMYMFLFYY